jgi:hypothetical protein
MKFSRRERQYILSIALAVVLSVGGVAFFFAHTQAAVLFSLTERKNTLTHMLLITSERIDRNEPSSELATLLASCPNSGRFDDLLSRLATLHDAELGELAHMFDTCGDYPSLVKRLTLRDLKADLEEYERTSLLLHALHPTPGDDNTFGANMRSLYEMEQERSQNFRTQIQLQKEIIASLLSHDPEKQKAIPDRVFAAQTIGSTLNTLNTKIDDIRARLAASKANNDPQS